MNTHVVDARSLSIAQADRLFLLEMAKDEGIPPVLERVTFDGQTYMITGVLDFGDGHGPKVLALLQDADVADVLEENT